MMVVRLLVFVAGLLLVGWTLLSAIRTVVLPRSAQSVLSRVVFRGASFVFRIIAGEKASFARRDRVWALFGPVGLLALAAVWVVLVELGFMAMFWAVEDAGWSEAFLLSGSSLLTLGFAPADTFGERIMAFSEATIGLGLVALLIAFLPALYSSFQRREVKVGELEVRAGTPPSAAVFLTRLNGIGRLDEMESTWLEWETWFIEIQESHTSYPALNFFRSPVPDHHWVTAAGTVLDAAAFVVSSVDIPRQPEPQLCLRAGFIGLRRIADFFGIEYDADPNQTDSISISRQEFDEVYEGLREAGVPMLADQDQAWIDWAGWRVNYDTVLLQLAELTLAPYAPWTSDRSSPSHRQPQLKSWGKRLRSK
ncbi:MAG: hypothetical protein KJP22_04575 [Acidimicrobiia bacterium]|nr:hypothetical protein [Acidimicrobiia bacterium]MBT8192654.1 hypothetical protein [Acidimicrobiia bacterium]